METRRFQEAEIPDSHGEDAEAVAGSKGECYWIPFDGKGDFVLVKETPASSGDVIHAQTNPDTV